MNDAAIRRHIEETFNGVVPVAAWGETAFFYNPGRVLPRGVYFCTLKDRDGDHDRASRLDRPGIFRLNLGVGQETYRERFGALPPRPPAGGVVDTGHDFAALDVLMPHPVYAWMGWVCILNPGADTFADVERLLAGSYEIAARKFHRRTALGC